MGGAGGGPVAVMGRALARQRADVCALRESRSLNALGAIIAMSSAYQAGLNIGNDVVGCG